MHASERKKTLSTKFWDSVTTFLDTRPNIHVSCMTYYSLHKYTYLASSPGFAFLPFSPPCFSSSRFFLFQNISSNGKAWALFTTRLSTFWGTFSVSERTQRRLTGKVSVFHAGIVIKLISEISRLQGCTS